MYLFFCLITFGHNSVSALQKLIYWLFQKYDYRFFCLFVFDRYFKYLATCAFYMLAHKREILYIRIDSYDDLKVLNEQTLQKSSFLY